MVAVVAVPRGDGAAAIAVAVVVRSAAAGRAQMLRRHWSADRRAV